MTTKGEFSVVGQPLPKIDAWAKVTGQTRYADDLTLPRMAFGRLFEERDATPIRTPDTEEALEAWMEDTVAQVLAQIDEIELGLDLEVARASLTGRISPKPSTAMSRLALENRS